MVHPSRARAISALVCILAASPCFGWGRDGHKIAGTIAEQHLTPEAKAAVARLLGKKSLADVSTWADEIRSNSAYRWANPLHYSNVKPGAPGFDLKRDCPPQGCVVSAIIKYAGVLRSKDTSAAKKAEALKFLVHFVQDVHQPLHVSRARDKGGNDIKVAFFKNRTNLHRVWDSGLIRRMKKPWSTCAAELQQAITPKQLAEWKNTDPVVWATESYKLALSHAYAIPKNGQLGQPYVDRCIPVVKRRLSMAGIRLATLLNATFATPLAAGDSARQAIDRAQPLLRTKDHQRAVKLLESAVADLRKATTKDPSDVEAFSSLGMALFYLDLDADAARQFDRAIELAPNDAYNHFMRGILAKFQDDWPMAAKELAKAKTLDPKRSDYWYEWAGSLEELKKPEAAGKAYRKTLELAPDHTSAMSDLAGLLMEAKKVPEALQLYDRIVKLDPKDVTAHYNIAQIYQSSLLYRQSLASFRTVVRLDPDDWRSRAKIIQNLQALRRIPERDKARDALLKLHGDGKVDSELFCRDQFKVGESSVMVFEYFKLEGEEPVRYSFRVNDPESQKSIARISLGSYDYICEHARNSGKISKDQRYFHLDRYFPDDKHETFRFFVGEPTYDETRKLVVKILEGKLEPESSMTPTKDGAVIEYDPGDD